MPRVNIWIRKEDWEKWEAVENKPALIATAIKWHHGGKPHPLDDGKPIKALQPLFNQSRGEVTITPNLPGKSTFCKHYQFKGQCLVKGCK